MLIRILGAAAGGGFPQWNCLCRGCEMSRSGKATSLTQSSIAIQSQSGDWFLINASPDVRLQIEQMRAQQLFVDKSRRSLPFTSIVLTDAEIDHTTGLMLYLAHKSNTECGKLRVFRPEREATRGTSVPVFFLNWLNDAGLLCISLPLHY
jgi:coenzyme PQQ biosynthesis protein B